MAELKLGGKLLYMQRTQSLVLELLSMHEPVDKVYIFQLLCVWVCMSRKWCTFYALVQSFSI